MKSPIIHEFITLIQDLLPMRTKTEHVLLYLVFLKALKVTSVPGRERNKEMDNLLRIFHRFCSENSGSSVLNKERKETLISCQEIETS